MELKSKSKLLIFNEENEEIDSNEYESEREMEEIAVNINNDSIAIENNISNIINVLDIYKETENTINDIKMYNRDTKEVEENITEDIVNIVNENYIYTLGMLGIKKDELKYINFSKEEFTPKQRCELSLEGFIDTVKEFFKKILDILLVIGKKLKEWIIKIINKLNNDKSILKKLKIKIHDNSGKEFKFFSPESVEKIKKMFECIMYVIDNEFDAEAITNYFASDNPNPFALKLSSLYKYINIPKSAEDEGLKEEKMKLMEEIRTMSCKNEIHKLLIETIEEVDNCKCYFITKTKGRHISYYGIKNDDDYTYGLPIKYLNCSINTFNNHPFELIGIKKIDDFLNYIKIIENNIDNQNKYFDKILKLNRDALKLVKSYQNNILQDNDVDDGLKMIMKRNLSFLQSLGSTVVFDNCYQYAYYNKAMINVVKLALSEIQNKEK